MLIYLILLQFAIQSVSFQVSRKNGLKSIIQANPFLKPTSLRGINTEGLPIAPINDIDVSFVHSISENVGIDDSFSNTLQNGAILLAGLAFLVYDRRPRGSVFDNLVDIRKSSIIDANSGVFASQYIPKGTKIGTYPGFLIDIDDNLSKSKKILDLISLLIF